MLTQEHNEHRMQVCQELLNQYEDEGDSFLDHIITGDETWCHHYEPIKDGLYGQQFPSYNAVVQAVKQWATSAGADFYERSMQALVHRWRKCIANGGDYVEK